MEPGVGAVWKKRPSWATLLSKMRMFHGMTMSREQQNSIFLERVERCALEASLCRAMRSSDLENKFSWYARNCMHPHPEILRAQLHCLKFEPVASPVSLSMRYYPSTPLVLSYLPLFYRLSHDLNCCEVSYWIQWFRWEHLRYLRGERRACRTCETKLLRMHRVCMYPHPEIIHA